MTLVLFVCMGTDTSMKTVLFRLSISLGVNFGGLKILSLHPRL